MDYHKKLAGEKTLDRVSKQSLGKTVAQSIVFGTYGALKYNEARANNVKRGKSAVKGMLYNGVNNLTGNLVALIEPRLNH